MSVPDTYRLPLADYPGANRLVLDWLAGDQRFLPRGSAPPRQRTVPPELSQALIESNRRWGLFVREDVERWARGEGQTIIAGQQVGFGGGPLYTLAKIASLVKMKRELEAAGTPVTLFFWLATEDHDFDEIATLNVPVSTLGVDKEVNRQLDLLCMRAVRTTEEHLVVGPLPVPSGLSRQLAALFDLERPEWLRDGVSFRDSFAELLATVFGKDIVIIDALLPELRRAGASLFEQIRVRRAEIQQALTRRSEELAQAGYSQQVVPRDGDEYTLLFALNEDGERTPEQGVASTAERTSTSALTRPLLQDFVIRPDVFVGGPAEVAYYAQLAPLHELLGIEPPRVALRGHALIAPKRVVRAIGRYGLEPAQIFASADAILADREPEAVAKVRAIAAQGREELLRRVAQIGELALPADHSLAGAITRSIGHLEFHFDKLTQRAIKGVVRKDRERYAATRELVATLYPDQHVQDRVVSWFAWWQRYGGHLIDRLIEEIEPDSDSFKIIGL